MDRPRREVQRRRIYEDIVEYLLEDIRNGVYPVGAELPSERSLMDEFQVGRPAVRESLNKLERMGIIETKPGVRARVCFPTVSPLLEEMTDAVRMNLQSSEGDGYFQDARRLFESALAREAAKKINEAQLSKLKGVLKAHEDVLDDVSSFADRDVEFHKIIAETSGNPIFSVLYHYMNQWLLEQRLATLTIPGQSRKALEAHRKIYEAIAAHDAERADAAMDAHLLQVREAYQNQPS
ncbi:GntR family transcriptional regulator [Synergistales bacterium]|nr:GntR family transcriptional regulator [Synergistales bacterium]